MNQLNPKQERALNSALALKTDEEKSNKLLICGPGGTGKTELVKHFNKGLTNVIFLAFTNKAVSVIRSKVNECNAATITTFLGHQPHFDENGDEFFAPESYQGAEKPSLEFWWNQYPPPDCNMWNVVVVDECSMIPFHLFIQLEKLKSSVVYMGDKEQLPPVDNDSSFDIFQKVRNRVELTDIVRANNADILDLQSLVRTGNASRIWADLKRRVSTVSVDEVDPECGPVMCFMRKNVNEINTLIRGKHRENDSVEENGLTAGDLIYFESGCSEVLTPCYIYRVESVRITSVEVPKVGYRGTFFKIKLEDIPEEVYSACDQRSFATRVRSVVRRASSSDHSSLSTSIRKYKNKWQFGYAITVHKSQGSEYHTSYIYKDVCYAKKFGSDYFKKLLYTAASRAQNEIKLVVE